MLLSALFNVSFKHLFRVRPELITVIASKLCGGGLVAAPALRHDELALALPPYVKARKSCRAPRPHRGLRSLLEHVERVRVPCEWVPAAAREHGGEFRRRLTSQGGYQPRRRRLRRADRTAD